MASLSVNNNLDAFDGAVLAKDVVYLLFCGVDTQAEDAEAPVWLGVVLCPKIFLHCPAAVVPATVGHGTAGVSPAPTPSVVRGRVAVAARR